MNVDIVSILYLIIRLSPLLVVSHFVMDSILNMDSKGIIYLTGLMFTSIFAISIGATMSVSEPGTSLDLDCKSMGFGDFQNVSMSQVTLGFTYSYLLYIILNFAEKGKTYVSSNIPTIVLFPILIIGNGLWQSKCVGLNIWILSLGLGACGGALWALMLESAGYKHLALFNGISNQAICKKEARTKFKCVRGR
jgi:hypothetical protein